MPNSDCSKCGKYKCKDGHVYVIELNEDSALKDDDFAPSFNRDDFKQGITKCFYVGQSGPHTPQCRYNQHVAKRKKPRKVMVYDIELLNVDKNLISALATLQGKEDMASHVSSAKVPDFPISGADLIAKGMNPGPEMGAKLGQLKQQWKQSNFTATKDDLLKENSDLGTQRGRLEYYLKKPVEDGMLVHLSGLGKFHKGNDSLADIVPERNGMYALHPDKWESTFYSLTNKDFKKIVHYKPTLIKAPSDMIVADMAIANRFYRTDNPEEQDQLAKEYKDSIGKDVSSMKMPEVIMSATVNEDTDFVTLKKGDKLVKVHKSRVSHFLDRHYKIVEKITKATPMGAVIDDFYKSDAPQFKGKSKAKKRQMAIAAKLSLDENQDLKNVN